MPCHNHTVLRFIVCLETKQKTSASDDVKNLEVRICQQRLHNACVCGCGYPEMQMSIDLSDALYLDLVSCVKFCIFQQLHIASSLG